MLGSVRGFAGLIGTPFWSTPPLFSPRANQFRLVLHTAAYWLLHTLRAASS
jgi:hypothetical protein